MLFVETQYTLATEEAERIGVDHVARLSNTGTVDGSTGAYMTTILDKTAEMENTAWRIVNPKKQH